MNWRETPFVRLALPFALGIAAAEQLPDFPVSCFLIALTAAALAVAALSDRKYQLGQRWVFGAAQQALLLLLGCAHALMFNELRRPDHFSKHDREVSFYLATVADEPSPRGRWQRFAAKIETVGRAAAAPIEVSGNVLVYLENDSAAPVLRYGDRLWLQAQIVPAAPSPNPQAFDFQRYLHFQNIHYQSFVRSGELRLLSRGGGNWFWQTAYACRARLLDLLRAHFPTPDEYAVAAALLIGYKDGLSDEIREAYAETGSMHALAVSGTHVGVIFFGLMLALRRLPMSARRARWLEPLLALACIWAFTLLTGATASVVRAATMFSLFLLGKALFREVSTWNLLAASAFVLLLFNPFWLFDAGFQLSYAAVAGMALFYGPLHRRSPVFRARWANWLWSTLLVGATAQLGTLPLSLYYFHQFPTYFWLSGWLVVMGGAVFLYGGFLLAVLAGALPWLAKWLGDALYWLVWGMNKAIFAIQNLPFSLIEGIWLGAWAAALLYLAMAFFAAGAFFRKPAWLVAGMATTALLLGGRAARDFGRAEQREIAVYSLSRRSLVDFFDGETLVSLSDSVPKKQADFAARAHRTACGGRLERSLLCEKDTVFVGKNLFWQPPVAQFFGKKIAVVDSPRWLRNPAAPPLSVDVALLRGNARVRVADCARQFGCRFFVFDGSSSPRRVEEWKKDCRALGFAWHDVREQGAWVLRF